jgi:hypothetical protein
MRASRQVVSMAILCGLVGDAPAGGRPGKPAAPVPATLLEQSDIVFVGSVLHHYARSFPEMEITPNTLVVKIDQLLEKPAAVALADGDLVSVEALSPWDLPVGTRAIFYSEGWIFGSGVAVRELHHELLGPAFDKSVRDQIASRFVAARERLAAARLRARVRAADLIVVGEVVAVRPGRAREGEKRPLSPEDDPQWREAIVRVDEVVKPVVPPLTSLVIRFPGSRDRLWSEMPKFVTGQRGTFLLKNDEIPLAHAPAWTTFKVISADDSMKASEASRVAAALQR